MLAQRGQGCRAYARFAALCALSQVVRVLGARAPQQEMTQSRVMRRRIRRLSSQILLAQLAILVVSMLVGFLLLAQTARSNLDSDYQARAAAIAQTFAGMPEIQNCMANGGTGCDATVQNLA